MTQNIKRNKISKELSLGPLKLANPVITAPIAGYTSRVFRNILRKYDPGLVFGEMISAQALCYNNRKTIQLLGLEGEAFPKAVQLCGGDPDYMAEAALIVADYGADLIDINMGCPAPKIVKNKEGCYLMLYPQLAGEIMERVVKSVKLPVTAKIRSGWNEEHKNCRELSRILEASGARGITVHGRTRDQFYRGTADWEQIKAVKSAVAIPVVGNGDIFTPQDALDMLSITACDGVMLGRGILGNPWLVKDVALALEGRPPLGRPEKKVILRQALDHLQEQVSLNQQGYLGSSEQLLKDAELAAVRSLRGHLSFYIKGMSNSAYMRNKLNQASSVGEITELFAIWSQ